MSVTFATTDLSFDTPGLKAQVKTVTVTNTGTAHLTLSLGAGASSDFTFTPSSAAPGVATPVTVTYRPTTASGSATLNATAVSSTTVLAAVSLGGTATNPLTVTGNDYGTTTPGATRLGLVLVQNGSDTAATVTGPTTPFVLNDAYDSVAGGAVIAIPVTFAPTAAGQWSQTVTVTVGIWTATATIIGVCADTLTEVDTSPPSFEVAPASDAGTTYQSYYISVPNPASSLNLGYRRAATQKVDGLGVDTVGNAYVRVSEDIGILANGTTSVISMQSTTDTNLVAGGDFFVGATGATWLVGTAGISIATFDNSATTDSTTYMPTDDGIKSTKDKINIAAATFISLDVLVGAAALAAATHSEVTSARMFGEPAYGGWVTKGSKAATILSAASAVALDITSVRSATTGAAGAPGVTIYGHAGILAGTPGFASYYAGAGLVIGSLYPTMVGMDTTVMAMKDMSLLALREANLSGGKTTVHGTEEVKIESAKSVGIRVQEATTSTKIEVSPTKLEATTANGAITSSFELSSTELTVTTTDGIELDAGDAGTITLKAGGWELKISSAGLTFEKAVGGGPLPSLKIAATTATLQASATSAVKLTPTDATLQLGTSTFHASATGVETKGPLHNLG